MDVRSLARVVVGRDAGRRARWRRAAGLVTVLSAGAVLAVSGLANADSSVPSGYVSVGPVKLLTNTSLAANKSSSPVVIGGATTVPTDANSIQLSISITGGTAVGDLLVAPAGDPTGTPALAWTAGKTVTATTVVAPGTKDEVTFVNNSSGSVKVTATITAYSAQGQVGATGDTGPQGPAGPIGPVGPAGPLPSAANFSPVGGTTGQVLTNTGSGTEWTTMGKGYAVTNPAYPFKLPYSSYTYTLVDSLTVPAGSYFVLDTMSMASSISTFVPCYLSTGTTSTYYDTSGAAVSSPTGTAYSGTGTLQMFTTTTASGPISLYCLNLTNSNGIDIWGERMTAIQVNQ